MFDVRFAIEKSAIGNRKSFKLFRPAAIRRAMDDGRHTPCDILNPLQADGCLEEALMGGIAEFPASAGPITDCQKNRKSNVSLTSRETQILRWIADGKTNKQIAQMLNRSVRTVEYHRNRLMKKLNAHTAAEMVKQAIRMGIL